MLSNQNTLKPVPAAQSTQKLRNTICAKSVWMRVHPQGPLGSIATARMQGVFVLRDQQHMGAWAGCAAQSSCKQQQRCTVP